MVRLRKTILTILNYISLGADAGCLSGLMLNNAAYKLLLGITVSFDCMIGAYKSYDPSIEDDATDGLCKKMDILKVVQDTWFRHL